VVIWFAGVPGGSSREREKSLSKFWKKRLWSYFYKEIFFEEEE